MYVEIFIMHFNTRCVVITSEETSAPKVDNVGAIIEAKTSATGGHQQTQNHPLQSGVYKVGKNICKHALVAHTHHCLMMEIGYPLKTKFSQFSTL